MKKKALVCALLAALALPFAPAADGQSLTPEVLARLKAAHQPTAADRALRNALARTGINDLALTAGNTASTDTYFSHEVPSKGITDQKQSGRCWLFSGLNVMRSRMIRTYGLGEFQFSQSYLFFYDQLEKSNLFLQAVIDNAGDPLDTRTNDWLFHNPLSDGGTFCGVQYLATKYGVVPAEAMPESYNANNTSRLSSILSLKLREYGLALRRAVAAGKKKADVQRMKEEQLGTVYHILQISLGTPPEKFSWTRRDAAGRPVSTREYTPAEFYDEYVGADLMGGYVMLMNDPSRPYYKTYTVQYDRHAYDGADWTYLNLPMEDIERIGIASIKDSTMMYMSCDVGKCYDRNSGVLSLDNFSYEDLFSTDFPMDKADRIRTFASASSHAMTLMAVDLDAAGQPVKWMVENSWGPSAGHRGHLIMTRDWFREYLFRLVPERKYVPADLLKLFEQKPVQLPAWDPLFAGEE